MPNARSINSKFRAAICACILISFALLGQISSGPGDLSGEPEKPGFYSNAPQRLPDGNADRFVSHAATRADIEAMIASDGIREPGKNYNKIVNGHGTGLAPATFGEYEDMIGTINVVDGVANPAALPPSLDHSAEPCFPAVGDQGGQGSCTSWSIAYYANGYAQARDNGWSNATNGDPRQLMSPAWVYNMVNDGVDSGATRLENAKLIMSVGNARLLNMPYNPSDCTSWGNETAWREAPQYRSSNVSVLNPPFDVSAVQTIKNALYTNHLVTFGLNADDFNTGLGSGDDTLSSPEVTPIPTHANTIVGYDDAKGENGEVGSFKIVNSWGSYWGSAWGGNGFYWMTYQAFLICQHPVVWFEDIPQYQPSMLGVWRLASPTGTKDAKLELGLGAHGTPNMIRKPLWSGGAVSYPDFMCLDISEFQSNWSAGINSFYLEITAGTGASTITSFKIEYYQGAYTPGMPTMVSAESPDTPKTSPCYVTASFGDSFNIDLLPGWNMISFPLLGVSVNASALGLSPDSNVSRLNLSAQGYEEYVCGISPPSSDFALTTGTGYMVRVDSGKTVAVVGIKPDGAGLQTVNINVPPSGGWALVGWNSLNSTRHASDLASYVQGATVKDVSMWNATAQRYDDFIAGISPHELDFTLNPGNGYLIWVSGPCTLEYYP